jgi:hypothetical protein
MLQDGAGAMQVAQELGIVTIANMSVHAGGRKEPTAARKGKSAVAATSLRWQMDANSNGSPSETGDIRTLVRPMIIVLGALVCNCPLHGPRREVHTPFLKTSKCPVVPPLNERTVT